MKVKKMRDENGEYVFLPKNHNIGDYAIWIKVPDGLLLKNSNSSLANKFKNNEK